MSRKVLVTAFFSKLIAVQNFTDLYHVCKAHPDGAFETYKSNCKWLFDYQNSVKNDDCAIHNSEHHSASVLNEYITQHQQHCCANGLCNRSARKLDAFPVIRGYGCWCSLSSYFSFGRGPAKDDLDQECRNVVENYRCNKVDLGKDICPEHFISYQVIFSSFLLNPDVLHEKCEHNQDPSLTGNQKICALNRCKIDFKLLHFMLSKFGTGYTPNKDLIWTEFGGNFNPEKECPKAIEHKTACCGEFPDRTPYNPDRVGCCNGSKYYKFSEECCKTGNTYSITESNTCVGLVLP